MIKVEFSSQVEQWTKELQKFSANMQNNIHIGGLRVVSNVVKDYMAEIPFVQQGKNGTYIKNLRKNQIGIRKRKRTKLGWERFKISIIREPNDPQERNKSWYYNIITNSKEQMRYTKGNKIRKYLKKGGKDRDTFASTIGAKKRGVLKRDPFMQRATKVASKKALNGYVYYVRTRILADGAKVSRKIINQAKKSGF